MLKWYPSWCPPFLGGDSFVFLDIFSLTSSQAPGQESSNQWKARLPSFSNLDGVGLNFKHTSCSKEREEKQNCCAAILKYSEALSLPTTATLAGYYESQQCGT